MGGKGSGPVRGLHSIDGEKMPSKRQPTGGAVTRPAAMSPYARRIWDSQAAELIEEGILTTLSCEQYRMYCEDCSRSEAAHELIDRDGMTVIGTRGTVILNPAVRVQREAEASAVKIARSLGLMPSERGVLKKRDGPPYERGDLREFTDTPTQATPEELAAAGVSAEEVEEYRRRWNMP
jgi:P27 family predicted phage terminase small subunit